MNLSSPCPIWLDKIKKCILKFLFAFFQFAFNLLSPSVSTGARMLPSWLARQCQAQLLMYCHRKADYDLGFKPPPNIVFIFVLFFPLTTIRLHIQLYSLKDYRPYSLWQQSKWSKQTFSLVMSLLLIQHLFVYPEMSW